MNGSLDLWHLLVVLLPVAGGLLGIVWRIGAMSRQRADDREVEIKRQENIEYRLRDLEDRKPWN